MQRANWESMLYLLELPPRLNDGEYRETADSFPSNIDFHRRICRYIA